MRALVHAMFVAAFVAAPVAQERAPVVLRDLSLVQRLRVVCSDRHFGRVDDLVVELPSGRVLEAVVTMVAEAGPRTVLVPYGALQYEPPTNLMRLGNCPEKEDVYQPFDAAAVQMSRQVRDDGTTVVEGRVLASRLAQGDVVLSAGGVGTVQGLTLELVRGHVAFLDVAIGRERAGDSGLHPVPWAALQLRPAAAVDVKQPLLGLERTAAVLAAAPNLVEIIVQSPLYRARLYAFFVVSNPAWDADA